MVSFMEIYNERIRDLLDPDSRLKKRSLDVRLDKNKRFHVPDLTMHVVTTAAEILNFVRSGQKRRETAPTHQNSVSSRSHAILTMHIESCVSVSQSPAPISAADPKQAKHFRFAKINFVDLAGSGLVCVYIICV